MSLYTTVIGVYSVRGQNLENCLEEFLKNFADAVTILDDVYKKIKALPHDAMLLDLLDSVSTKNLWVWVAVSMVATPLVLVGMYIANTVVDHLQEDFQKKMKEIDEKLNDFLKQVSNVSLDTASLELFMHAEYIKQKFATETSQIEAAYNNFKASQREILSVASSLGLTEDANKSDDEVDDFMSDLATSLSYTIEVLASPQLKPDSVKKVLNAMKSSLNELNVITCSVKTIRMRIIEEIHEVRRSFGKNSIDNAILNTYVRLCMNDLTEGKCEYIEKLI